MKGPEEVRAWLAARGLRWELVPVPQGARTVDQAAKALAVERKAIAKTLIVLDEDRAFAVVLRGDTRLDFGKLSKALGGRPRLARPEEVRQMTGFDPGGVPPIALPEHVRVVLDGLVAEQDVVYAGGGSEAYLLRIPVRELLRTLRPLVADVSGPSQLPSRI